MIKEAQINRLKKLALQCRKDILIMTTEAGSGHPGGSLSAADIIITLYFYKMKHNPKKPDWQNRDRFILSKGHACPALYSCLARSGYFPVSLLKTLRKPSSPLQGHPEQGRCPGIEASTGPLGQGLGFGVGVALAGKLDKKSYRVYVMIGGGECDEGNIWESAMAAAHYKLSNLTAILDHNRIQLDDFNKIVMNNEPLGEKFRAFGWKVVNANGHDFRSIINALEKAENTKGKPSIIIADTIKGKGVKMMENKYEWHGKPCPKEQLKKCLRELDKNA